MRIYFQTVNINKCELDVKTKMDLTQFLAPFVHLYSEHYMKSIGMQAWKEIVFFALTERGTMSGAHSSTWRNLKLKSIKLHQYYEWKSILWSSGCSRGRRS